MNTVAFPFPSSTATHAGEGVQVHLDPNFDSIITDETLPDTMWFLIADPGMASRPSFIYSKLQGYESPQIFKEVSKYERVWDIIFLILMEIPLVDMLMV